MKGIIKTREFGIFAILVLVCAIITSISPTFLTLGNLVYLFKTNLVMWTMSLGMLLVIISGGIDVSVSANIVLVTVAIGKLITTTTTNIVVVLLLSCLLGCAIGIINGFIISKFKIPPIVATLGVMSIINGAVLWYTNGSWITNLPKWFKDFGSFYFFELNDGQGGTVKITIQFLLFAIAVFLTWFILKYTVIGRGVYAVGGNPVSAERIGFNVSKVTIFIYGYLGFITGLAALMHTSIMMQVDPNAFNSTELMVIAAVVIDGANVMGGSGTILGTLLGCLLLAVLNNGLVIARVPTFWQKIVVGFIILFAVSSDILKRNREIRNLVKVDIE